MVMLIAWYSVLINEYYAAVILHAEHDIAETCLHGSVADMYCSVHNTHTYMYKFKINK